MDPVAVVAIANAVLAIMDRMMQQDRANSISPEFIKAQGELRQMVVDAAARAKPPRG